MPMYALPKITLKIPRPAPHALIEHIRRTDTVALHRIHVVVGRAFEPA